MKIINKILSITLACSLIFGVAACDGGRQNVDGKDKNYNFYMTVSTNPTMWAVINSYKDTSPSEMIYARKGTLSNDIVPEHLHVIETPNAANNENLMDVVEMGKKVAATYKANPKGHFTFYVDDLNTQYFLDCVIAAGIPAKQFKLVLISDGSGTYSKLLSETKDKTDDQIMEYYNTCVDEYKFLLGLYEDGKTFVGYTNGDRAPEKYVYGDKEHRALYGTTMTNIAIANNSEFEVEYQMQFPDEVKNKYFPAADYPKFNALLSKTKLVKFVFGTMFNGLNQQQRDNILNGALNASFIADVRTGYYIDEDGNKVFDKSAAGDNKNTNALTKGDVEDFFKAGDPTGNKPILMIVGTKGAEYLSDNFDDDNERFSKALKWMYDNYHENYNIIYKPHPNQVYSQKYLDLFAQYNITLLPGRLPSTLLMWCYPNLMLGGYSGSSWYDANPDNTLFFIDGYDSMTGYLFGDKIQSMGDLASAWNSIIVPGLNKQD